MKKNLYPNLTKAMSDKGVTKTDLAILLGLHFNTITDKLEGNTTSSNKNYNIGFTILEACIIAKTLFKEYSLTWLFDCEKLNNVS